MKIVDDPHIKDFMDARNLRESTKRTYLAMLKLYFDFLNKTPTELIEEAEKEEDKRIKMKNRKIRRYLIDFIGFLKSENKSSSYIKNVIMVIRTFYAEFDIELPRLRSKMRINEEYKSLDEIVIKEDIEKILKYCNTKYKAIILLMSSSGMGFSEIRHLQYKDFINSLEIDIDDPFALPILTKKVQKNQNLVGTWRIRRYKTGMPYITFSTHESLLAICDYLLERESDNKGIRDEDDWLFESRGKQLNKTGFMQYFARLNDKAGFGFSGRQRFFRSHALRKYFASVLYKKGLPQLTIDWMLGHKVDKVTEAYFKADIEALKKEYMKVVKDLSIETVKIKKIATEEYKLLFEKYQKLFVDSQKKDMQIEKLTRQVEKINKYLSELEKESD